MKRIFRQGDAVAYIRTESIKIKFGNKEPLEIYDADKLTKEEASQILKDPKKIKTFKDKLKLIDK